MTRRACSPTRSRSCGRLERHLTEWIKAYARALGFDLVGIAPAQSPPHAQSFLLWLAQGYAGTMDYLERTAHLRVNPAELLPDARSAVVVGLNYAPSELPDTDYRIARYALGDDYHLVLREKLETLLSAIQAVVPGVQGRVCVDSAPVLERDLALMAGLGWYGKNTCLINTLRGSYFFIGVLLLTLELEYDSPAQGGCGTCRLCLDACPTGALVAPYQLDARKCISYLTIELREAIPTAYRASIGEWLFGCDICQEVCPFNRPREHQPLRARPTTEPRLQSRPLPKLAEILQMSEAEFTERFRGSAIKRAKWRGLVRNALIVAGNKRDPNLRPLIEPFSEADDPILREAAQWALDRYNSSAMAQAATAEKPKRTRRKQKTPPLDPCFAGLLESLEKLRQLDLPVEDGAPMESDWHYAQPWLLRRSVDALFGDRDDYYYGTNMFLYYSYEQAQEVSDYVHGRSSKQPRYKGPDFFLVLNVDGTKPRERWAVWEEGGRYPDLIIELISPSTEDKDKKDNMTLYAEVFRTPEYFWYDQQKAELRGFRLNLSAHKPVYEPIPPNERGWIWSRVL
ncbi:MAG: tRNA epoxyqueuosine(34) reductase QueG, partial [Fimbriimonadales bacterium]|nr:tRNA epoxyqueuosine(34) reductase QueG [Fimbriimonadales bacterium]